MRIYVAHVNVARGYRGGERQTELLIQGLAGLGIRQRLVARRGQPLAGRIDALGMEVRAINGDPVTVAAATGGVDLVHVHEGRSVYGAYLRRLLSNTPYIVTRRVDNPIGNHALAHRAYRSAAKVVALTAHVAEVVRRLDPRIEARVIPSASSGLEPNPTAVEAIRNAYPGKVLIGHVGALDNQKGQAVIIEAARALRASRPELQFLLIGSGPDEALLKTAAAGLANVAFTGFVDNVGDYLAAFDLFLLPSLREGLGSILLDAMEQRLPIIASRVGGIPEIVHDGENGVLVAPGRHDELKEAILRLVDAPEYRRRLGERGREIARQFTASAMCGRYFDVYREVLAKRRVQGGAAA